MRLFFIASFATLSFNTLGVPPDPYSTQEIICGYDNRVSSNDPYAARSARKTGKPGCSVTLIGNSCVVSAGHCETYNYFDFVEFNTPRYSSKNKVFPSDPRDIYQIDRKTLVYQWKKFELGHDWAVFQIKRNLITGLTAEKAQGGFREVSFEKPSIGQNIKIYGYGIDQDWTVSQTQQMHYGPIEKTENKTLHYRVDTNPGNSGSGIIDLRTGKLIGVHGGNTGTCRSAKDSGMNVATSLYFNEDFRKAVRNCLKREN